MAEEFGWGDDAHASLTPRMRFSQKKVWSNQIIISMMMHLDAGRIASIKREFSIRGGEIDIKDFVCIMKDHLPEFTRDEDDARPAAAAAAAAAGPDQQQPAGGLRRPPKVSEGDLIWNLCELFNEIDVNGDQMMEWDEFTGYIVEKAFVFQDSSELCGITDYSPVMHDAAARNTRHNNPIEQLKYVPELDSLVVLEQHNNVVHLYDSSDATLLGTLRGHRGVPTACEYIHRVPDSPTNATRSDKRRKGGGGGWGDGGGDGAGDADRGGRAPKRKPLKKDHVGSLVTCCADQTMALWELAPGPKQWTLRTCWPTPHAQMALCWVDRHATLFSASVAGMVHAWDVGRREEKSHLHGHSDIVMDLLNIDALDNICSAGLDARICLWDLYTGAQRQVLRGHRKGVCSMAYSGGHRLLVSAGFDHDALVWTPFVPTLLYKLKGHPTNLIAVEAVPDTPQIVTADADGVFKVWDLRTFQCMQTFTDDSAEGQPNEGLSGALTSFTTCHKGGRARVVAATKRLHFFDQCDPTADAVSDDLPITCAVFNSVSLTVISAAGRSVKIWNALTGKVARVYRDLAASDITALCLDDRQRKFFVGDHFGTIKCYNYSNGALMKEFDAHNSEVSNLVYCDEAKALLSTSWDRRVILHNELDPERGVILREMDPAHAHNDDLTAAALSHSLSVVATGSSDRSVRVWDFETGKLDGRISQHAGDITCMTFLEEYPLLLACDSCGWLRVWGVRMSPFKYECALSFEHLTARRANRTFRRPTRPASEASWSATELRAAGSAEGSMLWAEQTDAPDVIAEDGDGTAAGDDGVSAAENNDASSQSDEGKAGAVEGKGARTAEDASTSDDAPEYYPAFDEPAEWNAEGKTQGAGARTTTVQAIAWCSIRQVVYTGDERGDLRCYSLARAFKRIKAKTARLPVSTSLRRRSSFIPGIALKAAPDLDSSWVDLRWRRRVHEDGVTCVQLVRPPEALLLTASFDRTIAMFDLVGNKLGTLLQSVPESLARAPGWDVPMRVSEREAKEAAFTLDMMERTANGPSPPGDGDSDSDGPCGGGGPDECKEGPRSSPSPRSRMGNFLAEMAAAEDDARARSPALPGESSGDSDKAVGMSVVTNGSSTSVEPGRTDYSQLDRTISAATHSTADRLTSPS